MVTRRQFLKLSAMAGTGLLLSSKWTLNAPLAKAYSHSSGLRKFVQPMRNVFPIDSGGIPVAVPDGTFGVKHAMHYTIDIKQYTDVLHPDLGPTTLRGYHPRNILGGATGQRHLGGIIVAQRGKPIQITFNNLLSGQYPVPIDTSLMGADMGLDRACVHLHGGFVPWLSDGGPFAWFDPNGGYGESVVDKRGNVLFKAINPRLKPGQAEFYWPNRQSARFMWYHDHTIGITRTNAYIGMATGYIIRDAFESNLRNQGLPDFIENGGAELPIVIQDKVFVDETTIDSVDPTWPGPRSTGSLWYPHVYEPDIWDLEPPANPPSLSCVPEMFGDTMLANGLVYPEVTVEAKVYRFRILNACQARFLNLQLYIDDGSPDSITIENGCPTNAKGPDFLVLGTEGGFLPFPVLVPSNMCFNRDPIGGSLITAPAERWDLLVDFTGYEGQKIVLYSDAPAPFPDGEATTDFYPDNDENPDRPEPGFGPNTRQILRFSVVPATGKAMPLRINTRTDLRPGNEPVLVPLVARAPHPVPAGVKVRQLTLNEDFDQFGRLIQRLGTNVPLYAGTFARAYADDPTETPSRGKTEVWQIINLTGDTHPIHFHLVNVHVLSRQPFDVDRFNGVPQYTGAPRGPDATETGWKETVKMHPGEVTTVMMKFDLPATPFPLPKSPRTGGHEYVWHCHILEHEEHDMMRPLVVT